MLEKARYIVVEGPIGAGKTTLAKRLAERLHADLLLHDDLALDTPELTLPHPRAHQRAFVLLPLAELAPTLQIPGQGRVAALLAHVRDQAIERVEP